MPPLNLLGDYGGGGMLLAVGILSAILECRQSGVGQVVDVAMFDGAALLMTVFYGLFAEGRWEDRRQANVIDGAAHYYRTYETADAKHFAVGAMEPQFYAELCARLGVDVPQEDTLDAWAAHGDTMAARFREKTRAEWEAELVTPQSCASPVLGHGRGTRPSAQSRARHVRHRRRCGATGAGTALLADGGGRTVAAVAARRPHRGGPGRARSRECRVAANRCCPPERGELKASVPTRRSRSRAAQAAATASSASRSRIAAHDRRAMARNMWSASSVRSAVAYIHPMVVIMGAWS